MTEEKAAGQENHAGAGDVRPDRPDRARSHLDIYLYVGWVVALLATLGSLFFEEVMNLPPCKLCWYQRLALYPQVLLLPTGILLRDRRVTAYTLPLAGLGLAVAVYHNLLYYGVIPEALAPCTAELSCTTRQIDWLGFVSIPLLGLGAFTVVVACLALHAVRRSR